MEVTAGNNFNKSTQVPLSYKLIPNWYSNEHIIMQLHLS